MKAASLRREENENRFRVYRLVHVACVTITTIFCFYLLSYYRSTRIQELRPINNFIQNNKAPETETCDLFKGQWIRDSTGPLYTNYSCTTIPFKRNCLLHGRNNTDFLHWRWKPDKCKLRRFDPERFLNAVRGKTMAFIGDSIAQNQMESLLCLLSMVEKPKPIAMTDFPNATKSEIHQRWINIAWEFPKHNFTLMSLWSPFLVSTTPVTIKGSATRSFNLHLDRVDTNWSKKLMFIDYAVFSDAQWFFRPNYLYEGGKIIGCIYCHDPNVTDLGPGLTIRMAFRTAFKAINECENCGKIFTLVRTYSPDHYENGTWNNGGECNRVWPVGRDEVNRAGPDLYYRDINAEEMEVARKAGEGSGNKFEVVDVTEMMLMRPDGHPGHYWGNRYLKGYSDCIHWCMPGPIDTWNEILLEMIM